MTREEIAERLENAIKFSIRKGSDEWLQSGCPIRLDVFRGAIAVLRSLSINTAYVDPATGLTSCGCGGEIAVIKCEDPDYATTYYTECRNMHCGFNLGRRYDPICGKTRGEFLDAGDAIATTNKALSGIWKEDLKA